MGDNRCLYLFRSVLLLAGAAVSASAQTTCTASVGAPLIARAEGKTEPVGDLILTCTGGTPTPAGDPMAQENFTIFLNTPLTSHVTAEAAGVDFSEALLLVDEPNSLLHPARPVLNCGHDGAPDNGGTAGVCDSISDGTPADSYDGTPNISRSTPCDGVIPHPAPNTYTCGRPNAFQGRMSASNAVTFLGVPFDPPGGGTRMFRFTNLRANASVFGLPGPTPILTSISVNGTLSVIISGPVQTVAFSQSGLAASIPSPNVVHVQEDFAGAWKAQNVAFTLANATFGCCSYTYNGGTAYPVQAAQNVPGIFYNSEDTFQWQNNGLNAPPSPNPPAGFGGGPVTNLVYPLDSSLALGGVNTVIDQDGVSSAGTRIALTFTHVPGHATVTVPSTVYLHNPGFPLVNTGVMVLTSTDAAGAGPFSAGASTTIPDGGTAVYEVLYADPFSIEYADIACVVNHAGNGTHVAVSFAPFYSTASSNVATPTSANPSPTAIPRFIPAAGFLFLSK